MKKFIVYANCQGPALAKTLVEAKAFKEEYEYQLIKPVQTLRENDISHVREQFAKADLIICQPISSGVTDKIKQTFRGVKSMISRQQASPGRRPKELDTDEMLKYAKKNVRMYSFPSLYFNAYFPHLDAMNIGSVLNRVHDFIIVGSFLKGNSVEKTLEIINSETLYPKELSLSFVNQGLEELTRRESVHRISFTISEFIKENYKTIKLFNQFNHPRKPVFNYLAGKIFKELGIDFSKEEFSDRTGLDGTCVPLQKSTYMNLGIEFHENFKSYKVSPKEEMIQEEVVRAFYKAYEGADNKFLQSVLSKRKPFIWDLI